MNYNDILSKLSSQMLIIENQNNKQIRDVAQFPSMNNNTETVLNNIGLEIQRQGGY